MAEKRKRIAYIRKGSYPIPNSILQGVLQNTFPEYEVDTVDILDMFKTSPSIVLGNLFATYKEYGTMLLKKQITLPEAFYTTIYLFNKIREYVNFRISPSNYAFTFQIQSLFDGSIDGLPHYVYTDHTHLARLRYPGYDHKKLRPKEWIALERSIYERADVIFTRSSNITKSLTEQYNIPFGKIICIGVGPNINNKEIEITSDRYKAKTILFAGINWERKGGDDLVRAFEGVLKTHPDAKLIILGGKPDINIPNCKIIGKVPLEEMANYYRQASIFCLPTKHEPFGVVFIEALSYKLPIVATNVGAIPDFVSPGENGFLIEPGDVNKLTKYLNILLEDPEKCREFGEHSYIIYLSRYTWESVSAKISHTIRSRA